ncbi:hypothetical protein CR513_33337, partial [Mucuna pruriens]
MDIRPVYSCLLGRPWIHAAGAVPSSLHQKVKFVHYGEKELIISTPLLAEYIEGDEEALETSFQALEIVGTASAEAEGGDLKPSKAAVMAAKVSIDNGFHLGKGVSKELHSIAEPVTIQENSGQSGLGYTGAVRRERPGRGNQSKQQVVDTTQPLPVNPRTDSGDRGPIPELVEWVYPMARELDNWTAEVISDLVKTNSPNIETSHQINDATLTSNNAGESSRSNEGDDLEEEDLEELERLLE